MLSEKLVEQHRVHGVVAHTVNFALGIAHYQVRIPLGHLFGNQTKLRRPGGIALILKRHRFERQDSFAGFIYRLNLLLKPPRGGRRLRAELMGHRVYIDRQWWHPALISSTDAGNKGGSLAAANANGKGLAVGAFTADVD